MKTKKLIVGILAHVDAGKTTLAESILYLSGTIRNVGRVDHKNAFLDTFELEKNRGITIFAKQAELQIEERPITLLDTPGHVDFGAEMERTLQVLDYAILVINGMDGVQGYVMTLWNLLKQYQIPVFLFINKMDQDGADQVKLIEEIQRKLSENCLEFGQKTDEIFDETLALCDEMVMDHYLATGKIETPEIIRLIKQRKVFPCYFGSALKLDGVSTLLDDLKRYTTEIDYPVDFGAKIYKISRDSQGSRLTFLKITGGKLKVKMPLTGIDKDHHTWTEKVDQIRIYSGGQYQMVQEAEAGTVCAVTGLMNTYAGAGLGFEQAAKKPLLEPVLTYHLKLPEDCDVHSMYNHLCQLEEEEPQLHVSWSAQTNQIHVQVMGEVQIEILKSLILERFRVMVEFSTGSIVYKETIGEAVEGVGHFEPLRHYAEVHLLLEPAMTGSGISITSNCSEDMLDRNWQRLILTHLQEKKHCGVLTGSEITDLNITLIAGRAHQKHTEGGDFRQATYRAVRQGLKKAESILLEPIYHFRLEIPADKVGRALSDLQQMSAVFTLPEITEDKAVITGTAPVSKMRDYQTELITYSRGAGSIFCSLKGYQACHNTAEVIELIGYQADQDLDNPSSSVFCAHGTGFVVEWDRVEEYMHVESRLKKATLAQETVVQAHLPQVEKKSDRQADQELEEIFIRTYGAIDKRSFYPNRQPKVKPVEKPYVDKMRKPMEEYLIIDGYNIIFAWNELKELAKVSITGARDRLCEILCNYQGYKRSTVIIVFDAYKVEHGKGAVEQYKNIFIVYTKKAETADQYIERTVKEMGRKYRVTVATSDALEQMIIWGLGALRMSAQGLKQEIDAVNMEIRTEYLEQQSKVKNNVLHQQISKHHLHGEDHSAE